MGFISEFQYSNFIIGDSTINFRGMLFCISGLHHEHFSLTGCLCALTTFTGRLLFPQGRISFMYLVCGSETRMHLSLHSMSIWVLQMVAREYLRVLAVIEFLVCFPSFRWCRCIDTESKMVFKKIVGRVDFCDQFRKIIVRYKRIGYNINIMRLSACLVFNPITVNNFASLFYCTPVGRESDSMMAPT